MLRSGSQSGQTGGEHDPAAVLHCTARPRTANKRTHMNTFHTCSRAALLPSEYIMQPFVRQHALRTSHSVLSPMVACLVQLRKGAGPYDSAASSGLLKQHRISLAMSCSTVPLPDCLPACPMPAGSLLMMIKPLGCW